MHRQRRRRERAARNRDILVNRERIGRAILFQSRQRQKRPMRQTAGILFDQFFGKSRKSLELRARSLELGLFFAFLFSLLIAPRSALIGREFFPYRRCAAPAVTGLAARAATLATGSRHYRTPSAQHREFRFSRRTPRL